MASAYQDIPISKLLIKQNVGGDLGKLKTIAESAIVASGSEECNHNQFGNFGEWIPKSITLRQKLINIVMELNTEHKEKTL